MHVEKIEKSINAVIKELPESLLNQASKLQLSEDEEDHGNL